jgi:hypothetical protein
MADIKSIAQNDRIFGRFISSALETLCSSLIERYFLLKQENYKRDVVLSIADEILAGQAWRKHGVILRWAGQERLNSRFDPLKFRTARRWFKNLTWMCSGDAMPAADDFGRSFFVQACLWSGVRLTGKVRTGVRTPLCSLPDLLYRPEDQEIVLDRAEPHHSENSRINHGKYLLAILRVKGPVLMGIRGQVP